MRRALPWLCLALVLVPAGAEAQETGEGEEASERGAARVLFQEGVELSDEGRWAEAAERFGRALDITDSAVVRFNLSSALTELGRLTEASEHLRHVIRDEEAQPEVREAARERLAELEPRLARLTIHVRGAATEVQLNGQPISRAIYGVPMPVDPGPHTVTLERGGRTLETRTVELAEGQSDAIVFEAPAPLVVGGEGGGSEGAGAPGAGGDDGAGGDELHELWWLWATAGVVVVGAVVGIILGVTLSSGESCSGEFVPCRLDLP